MFSAIINGKVLDYNYKKLQENHYLFKVGDISIGQVFKMKFGWSAVVTYPSSISVGVVEGFKTRTSASQYMLQCTKLLETR